MNRKGLFFLIFSIGIAISVTWLNNFWLSYRGLVSGNKEKRIDYYLSDFSLLNTSTTGEIKYYMKAQHLVHKNSTGRSEIFNPVLQATDSDGKSLFIQAEHALQKESQGVIELEGSVLIKKTDRPEQDIAFDKISSGFTLETKDLSFDPTKREIFTNAAITLKTKDGMLTGKGLRSKLDEQELRILSNVHAKFDPTP